eukprot:g13181.t2
MRPQTSPPRLHLTEVPPEIPEDAMGFMQQCLIKDPTLRPSAAELGHHHWLQSSGGIISQVDEDSMKSLVGRGRMKPVEPRCVVGLLGRWLSRRSMPLHAFWFEALRTQGQAIPSLRARASGRPSRWSGGAVVFFFWKWMIWVLQLEELWTEVAAALGHHCRLLRGGEELTDAMTEIAVEDELTAIICSIEPWMKMLGLLQEDGTPFSEAYSRGDLETMALKLGRAILSIACCHGRVGCMEPANLRKDRGDSDMSTTMHAQQSPSSVATPSKTSHLTGFARLLKAH